jgi:hypothetical protein
MADRRTIKEIANAVAIPSYRRSLPQFKREIARSRRSQNPLAIIAIGPNGYPPQPLNQGLKKISSDKKTATPYQHGRLTKLEFVLCGPVFRDCTREIDITTYDGVNNQFIIALPETNKYQALQMVLRLKKILGEQVAGQLAVGIAEFPADGLYIDELFLSAINAAGEVQKITKG